MNFSENLVSSLIGAFCGAFFAFMFNIYLNKKKEERDMLAYLCYAISSACGLVSTLYSIKKCFVLPRVKENNEVKKILAKNNAAVIHVKHLSRHLHYSELKLPFVVEKMSFLASKDPNVISIIIMLDNSIKNLNVIICDYNAFVLKTHQEKGLMEKQFDLVSSYVDNLSKQIDSTLYLIEKVQELLVTYGKITFKKFKITNTDVDEQYRSLKPNKMESWEEIDWFPERKRWIVKLKNKLQKFK